MREIILKKNPNNRNFNLFIGFFGIFLKKKWSNTFAFTFTFAFFVTLSLPFRYPFVNIFLPFRYPFVTFSPPFRYPFVTFSLPFCYHFFTLSLPFRYPFVTFSPPFRYVFVTLKFIPTPNLRCNYCTNISVSVVHKATKLFKVLVLEILGF